MQKYAKHDVTGSNSCVGKIMAVEVPKNTKILYFILLIIRQKLFKQINFIITEYYTTSR